MSCESASRNATAPTPAIAPGAEQIDTREVAARLGSAGIDPRIPALVPGFDAPFFQAGLAGYSDAAMRLIARRHGCPFCVTEALLDRTLLAGGRGFDKADLGELHDNIPGGAGDHPLACQIMGSDPREMAASAIKALEQRTRSDKEYRKLAYDSRHRGTEASRHPVEPTHLRSPGGEQIGVFDPSEGLEDDPCDPLDHEFEQAADEALPDVSLPRCHDAPVPRSLSFQAIDVNLACPVKKISSKARGGHWLTQPDGAIEILQAVRDAVPKDVPCTVKLRRSYDDTPEMIANFRAIFAAAYEMGYAWATVHARTVEQKYVGPSRWTFLRELREEHPEKIIFGSGDVWNVHDIFRMIAYAGVSGVSVARGCIGNPWIFRQAREMMAGREPTLPTLAQQRGVLEEHFRLSLAVTRRFRSGEEATSKMMRKFAVRFAQHHPTGEEVRKRFIAVSSAEDWRRVLAECYEDPPAFQACGRSNGPC
jgi:tRNA-dihydrouridine synthase